MHFLILQVEHTWHARSTDINVKQANVQVLILRQTECYLSRHRALAYSAFAGEDEDDLLNAGQLLCNFVDSWVFFFRLATGANALIWAPVTGLTLTRLLRLRSWAMIIGIFWHLWLLCFHLLIFFVLFHCLFLLSQIIINQLIYNLNLYCKFL